MICPAATASFGRVTRQPLARPDSFNPLAWFVPLGLGLAGLLLWFIYYKPAATTAGAWLAYLPATNASLNALCAVCLVCGVVNIKRGSKAAHQKCMLAALVFSVLFLASYLVYHHFHGDTAFPGQGGVRLVYFCILVSHIVLSVVALPLVLTTVFYALRGQFSSHRRIARVTFPIWLYVSVTGVAVFFFLRAYV